MILIYTQHTTPRLQYIVNTLFGNDALVTESQETFVNHGGPKINYTSERMGEDGLWIKPYGLLNEEGIKVQLITCCEWRGLKIFFRTAGDLPFDLFSASFYLITRYEEYLVYVPDEYGRYDYTNSLAYKEGFLKLPLVNLWRAELENILQQKFGHLPFSIPDFTFQPTYDIDIAFSYLHQPIWLNLLGFYRDLLNGSFDKVVERGNVYSAMAKDPFDVYDNLDDLHALYQLRPVYFFLMAAKRRGVDKNISITAGAMRRLVRDHAAKYTVGIHPSWQSGDILPNNELLAGKSAHLILKKEIETLNRITKAKTLYSRQHYIRMSLPATYRTLLEQGIVKEYSMGYGSINGFRASYVLPFHWYDLSNEEQTEFMVYPFCFMDANSCFEQKYSAEQAAVELQYYHDIVKQVHGHLITIFHNHFLTLQPQWLPWRKMYEAFLKRNFS